ncbi:putative bifunctional methylenetetrahydrofolate dehydrogenase/cyclohydrolase 2 [Pitangus sulphuratus]|nr:putative bifunctional methylenetetrahydrofolate dehydrogenase/cyclohydrolase 2 [Pitangus sulphuratus]
MTGKAVAAVLTLLLISALGTQGKALARSAIELRCQCIGTHSRFIHPKFIQNVNLSPSGPHCKNVEVIATLKDGREVCLEPTASWVKLIIKAILDKATLKDGREVCLEPTAPWVRLTVKALLARTRAHCFPEPELNNPQKNSCPTMNGKLVAVLALFLLSAAVSQGRTLARMGTELRCQCIATHSRFIPPKSIQDVKLIQSGPHCKNVEVIATLKDGREVCLEPSAPWVQLIVKAILANDEATVISGTKLANQVLKEVQRDVESWISVGNKRPHLTVILVGDNPASHIYVRNKIKAAAAVGISSEVILRPKDISQEELLDMTVKLNKDSRVSGLLVQLPLPDILVTPSQCQNCNLGASCLPDHIDERRVCNAIAPEKDVDGFHIMNIGRLCLDQPSIIPATAAAVWEIIKRTGIPTFGKNVLVAGRSKNVGMPISMLLHTDGEHERPGGEQFLDLTFSGIMSPFCPAFETAAVSTPSALNVEDNTDSEALKSCRGDATVTITHRYTPKEQLKIHTQLADIVIVAAGVPKLITTDMVKEGAAVIDVGINHIHDPLTGKTKLVGDVDFEVDYTEKPKLLKLMQTCLEEHHSYCINGLCAFHSELRKPICKCLAGYNGERCEHLTLNSYAHDSYERYIAVGIGVGILTGGILAIIYCYVRKRSKCLDAEGNTSVGSVWMLQRGILALVLSSAKG